MQKQIEGKQRGLSRSLAGARLWLRRVMPRVALAASFLLVLWLSFGDTSLYRQSFVGPALRLLTICAATLTGVYYGLKALRWLKRKLLWRVRRRLIVTYLFIGLTPIILMTLLGLLSAFGGSGQGMARIITAQVNATERQTVASAHGLAEAFKSLPAGSDDRAIQNWLDERAVLMQASLPGARVALWRGAPGSETGTIGHTSAAQFVRATGDESTRGVGDDETPAGAPLPDWLR